MLGDGTSGNKTKLMLGAGSSYASSSFYRYGTAGGEITTGAWHHVACVFRGPDAEADPQAPLVYIDGSSSTVSLVSGALGHHDTTNAANFTVGNRPDLAGSSNNYYFTGFMDELAIFDDELTSGEISTIYNSGTPTDLTGHDHIQAWWRMGDDDADDLTGGSGQVTDQIASFNLTPVGTDSNDKEDEYP